MSIDAMQQALKALEYHQKQTRPIHKTQETITALRQAIAEAEKESTLQEMSDIGQEIEQEPVMEVQSFGEKQVFVVLKPLRDGDKLYTAPPKREIEQTPDDLLRQSEREGWRYAKECEVEIKRLTDLNRQLVAAAKELGAADDVHEWDDAWAKMAKLMRQGEINATSSQDGR